MRHLAAHFPIVFGVLGLLGGMPETIALGLILGGHLIVPVWAAKAPRAERTRALLLGPVVLIAVELVLLVIAWLILAGGNPEDTWISFYLLMIAGAALVLYALYCLIAYTIVVRRQR